MEDKFPKDKTLIWGLNVGCGTTDSRFKELLKEDKDGNVIFDGLALPPEKSLLKKIFPFLYVVTLSHFDRLHDRHRFV